MSQRFINNIFCTNKQYGNKLDFSRVFVNTNMCMQYYVFSIFHITKYFSWQNPLCFCSKELLLYWFRSSFVHITILGLRSGISHVYLFLFVYRYSCLQMFMLVYCHIFQFLLHYFVMYTNMWQIINWQACKTCIFRVLFTVKKLWLWYFWKKLYFLNSF